MKNVKGQKPGKKTPVGKEKVMPHHADNEIKKVVKGLMKRMEGNSMKAQFNG